MVHLSVGERDFCCLWDVPVEPSPGFIRVVDHSSNGPTDLIPMRSYFPGTVRLLLERLFRYFRGAAEILGMAGSCQRGQLGELSSFQRSFNDPWNIPAPTAPPGDDAILGRYFRDVSHRSL